MPLSGSKFSGSCHCKNLRAIVSISSVPSPEIVRFDVSVIISFVTRSILHCRGWNSLNVTWAVICKNRSCNFCAKYSASVKWRLTKSGLKFSSNACWIMSLVFLNARFWVKIQKANPPNLRVPKLVLAWLGLMYQSFCTYACLIFFNRAKLAD